jgi:hypothetical protein
LDMSSSRIRLGFLSEQALRAGTVINHVVVSQIPPQTQRTAACR